MNRMSGIAVPGRGAAGLFTQWNRRAVFGWVGLLLLALVPVASHATDTPYLINAMARFVIYGLAAVSLDLVLGCWATAR